MASCLRGSKNPSTFMDWLKKQKRVSTGLHIMRAKLVRPLVENQERCNNRGKKREKTKTSIVYFFNVWYSLAFNDNQGKIVGVFSLCLWFVLNFLFTPKHTILTWLVVCKSSQITGHKKQQRIAYYSTTCSPKSLFIYVPFYSFYIMYGNATSSVPLEFYGQVKQSLLCVPSSS